MAKGYGILLVLIGHLHVNELMVWIYSFHLPLFFLLSGYLFNVKSSFREFAVNKVKKILVPYCCLYIPIMLSELYFDSAVTWGNVAERIQLLVLQQRHSVLWFLSCILVLNFLYYPIVKWVHNRLLGACISMVMGLAGALLWRHGIVGLYWNVDVVLVVAPFFYIGYLMKGKVDEQCVRQMSPLAVWSAFAVLLAMSVGFAHLNSYIGLGREVDLFDGLFSQEWLSYPTALMGIMATVLLSARVCVPAIRYIGKNSLLFFAWHFPLVMLPVFRLLYRLGIVRAHDGLMGLVHNGVILMVTLIVLTLLNELVCRTRLRFIVGK